MTTDEMIKKLRRMGSRKMDILNRQDALFLTDAAERLQELEERIAIMTEPREATAEQLRFPGDARVMTYEEIKAAPDYSVLWEEVRIVWDDPNARLLPGITPGTVETSIAPVEKIGLTLYGSGMNSSITPELVATGGPDIVRYWSSRPTEAQREAEPWQ
jgi:hypothetical protein